VGDFVSGTDKIDLIAFGFADFAAVQAATTDVGGSAVIDLGGGNSVTLAGVLEAQLQAGDFILSPPPPQTPLKLDAPVMVGIFETDGASSVDGNAGLVYDFFSRVGAPSTVGIDYQIA
jgi:hypothetical protein